MVARPDSGTMIGGRYRLDERIGIGGSGEVWRAFDDVLDREVAVKLLRADVADDPSMRRLIEREARHAAALTATGIPAVHDVGAHDGVPFLVMELVRGESVADRLRRERPLPMIAGVEIAAAAADAVDAVHRAGVVHRDVKPENLLLGDDGRVRLTDFGICSRTTAELEMTEHSASLGTAQYVAPERARGAPPAVASDIYALGVVAYELLVGRRPFEGEPAAVLLAHVSSPPPPLPDTVPVGVRTAITRALHKNPAMRQQSGAAFAQELRAGVTASVTVAHPVSAGSAPLALTSVLPAPEGGTEVLPLLPLLPAPDRRGGSRAWAVAVCAVLVVIVVGSLAFAARSSGVSDVPGPLPVTDTTAVPTAPPIEPAPAEVEPVPVEAPAAPAGGAGGGGSDGRGKGKKDR